MAGQAGKPVDSGKGVYEALDPSQVTPGLVSTFQLTSLLLWAGLPGFALFQAFGPPPVQPTCEEGYSNISLLGVVAVAAVHVWNERNAWWMAKSLLTAPEILSGIMVLVGLLDATRTCYAKVPGQSGDGPSRLSGEDFFTLARFAGNCMMPSVATLCEEMAGQKRWLFDNKERHAGGVKPIRDAALGHITTAQREAQELHNLEESERTDAAGVIYLGARLLVNVLIGVILQLWVQASFFELVFEKAGAQMKFKLAAGMGISALLVAVRATRCYEVASKLGCFGVILIGFSAFFVGWTVAKVYGGVKCEDHIWNLSTGCVTLDKSPGAGID